MKTAPLPFLNLDAATALALPLAPVQARAEFRFCFQLPDGDATWLLARLCAIGPDEAGKRFQYCVVLRPENAETNRIFVAENLWYRAGRRQLSDWMTPAQATRWKWDLFEQSFNDNDYVRQLARFCFFKEGDHKVLLKFGADGWGAICESSSEDKGVHESERFIWQRPRRGVSHEVDDARSLRVRQSNFRRHVRALWKDVNGPIQTARRWMQLTEEQRQTVAFQCERGNWAQLREVASWVLMVYAMRSNHKDGNYSWNFTDYGYITVNKSFLKGEDEEILLSWRAALTESFGAHNVGAEGVKIDSLPLCLWSYIGNDELSIIEVVPPTMHEAIEALLKLRDWANAHCAPDEAARLLEILGA